TDVVDAQEAPEHGLAGGRIGREVGVADHEVIAMAHGAQRVEHVRVEHRIDRFQHAASLPLILFNSSYAGLTRVSIFFGRAFESEMDGRVKPGHDEMCPNENPSTA